MYAIAFSAHTNVLIVSQPTPMGNYVLSSLLFAQKRRPWKLLGNMLSLINRYFRHSHPARAHNCSNSLVQPVDIHNNVSTTDSVQANIGFATATRHTTRHSVLCRVTFQATHCDNSETVFPDLYDKSFIHRFKNSSSAVGSGMTAPVICNY